MVMMTDTIPVDGYDAALYLVFSQGGQNLGKSRSDTGFCPITTPKKNEAGAIAARSRNQARVIEISGDDGADLMLGSLDDFNVASSVKPDLGCVDGVISQFCEPTRQGWRERHVDKKFHFTGTVGLSSTASSSARNAA